MSAPTESVAVSEAGTAARAPRANVYRGGYSRFVGIAKRLLPGVALTLLLLVAIWPRLQTEIERVHLTLPRLDPREARDLRMVNARYVGVDRQNRPFVLTAETARQTSSGSDGLVALEGPKGDLTTTSGSWLEVTAYTGVYQPQAQLLDLFGNVQLFQDKGNEFRTDSAHVDMGQGTAEGHDRVEGQGPFGRVIGQGFRVLERGDVIIFTGRARLDLGPRPKTEER